MTYPNQAPPSTNAANLRSLVGLFNTAFTKLIQNTDGVLPAKVISYDRATNLAVVQPLITVISSTGKQTSRANISGIPVFQIGGGGFMLNFPVNEGNLGYIIANDRDTSLFNTTFEQSPPNTFRMKNFSDSIFLPSVMTNYTISEEDANNVVLQSTTGAVKISLSTNTITLTAPTVIINGNLNVNGSVALGMGGDAIARSGDPVQVDPMTGTGTITSGSLTNTSA